MNFSESAAWPRCFLGWILVGLRRNCGSDGGFVGIRTQAPVHFRQSIQQDRTFRPTLIRMGRPSPGKRRRHEAFLPVWSSKRTKSQHQCSWLQLLLTNSRCTILARTRLDCGPGVAGYRGLKGPKGHDATLCKDFCHLHICKLLWGSAVPGPAPV